MKSSSGWILSAQDFRKGGPWASSVFGSEGLEGFTDPDQVRGETRRRATREVKLKQSETDRSLAIIVSSACPSSSWRPRLGDGRFRRCRSDANHEANRRLPIGVIHVVTAPSRNLPDARHGCYVKFRGSVGLFSIVEGPLDIFQCFDMVERLLLCFAQVVVNAAALMASGSYSAKTRTPPAWSHERGDGFDGRPERKSPVGSERMHRGV